MITDKKVLGAVEKVTVIGLPMILRLKMQSLQSLGM